MSDPINPSPTPAPSAYTATSIQILKGLEAVQKRPGMYIGDVTAPQGLHHMLEEVLDNSVDEAQAGHAGSIHVVLHVDGSVSVLDDGRGIPVDIHPEAGMSAAEVILTTLHAGGKFDHNSYKTAGGLHGVGISVVNALSDQLLLTVYRDGTEYQMSCAYGQTTVPLHVVGPSDRRGTLVRFHPDPNIFTVTEFDAEVIRRRLSEIAYLCAGLSITFEDQRHNSQETFHAVGGMGDFTQHLLQDRPVVIPAPLHATGGRNGIDVDVAFSWLQDGNSETRAFTNTIPQIDGGNHVAGFRAGITSGVAQWIKLAFADKKAPAYEPEDLRYGLVATISTRVPDPKFSSQTKDKLVSSEVQPVVQGVVSDALTTWLEEHPALAKAFIEHIRRVAQGREMADRARSLSMRRGGSDLAVLRGKLDDCQSKIPAESELFIVEGDSAGGSAKQARNRKFQAVLPLRGKILNVQRCLTQINKVFSSEQVGTLISALGCGLPGQANFSLDRLRYHRVVIMTDADVDGLHIRCLLLTFFFRFYLPLIERGHLYVAQPPLYRLARGASEVFLRDDRDMARRLVADAADRVQLHVGGLVLGGEPLGAWMEELLTVVEAIRQIELIGLPLPLADVLAATGALIYPERLSLAVQALNNAPDAGGVWRHQDGWLYRRANGTEDGFSLSDIQSSTAVQALMRLAPWQVPGMDTNMRLVSRTGSQMLVGPSAVLHAMMQIGRAGTRINRFKGLGEMNPEQLWRTTLNPEVRVFRQICLQDYQEADETMQALMGAEPAERRALLDQIDPNQVMIDV